MSVRSFFRVGRRANEFPRNSGFLLTEALVTTVIGAFLLVALLSLVQLAIRAERRSTEISGEIETRSRALDAMSRDLAPAARTRWAGASSGFVFTGTPFRIAFARQEPESDDLRFVTLAAQDGPPSRVLRTSADLPPFAHGPADTAGGASAEVYSGRFPVRFAYFHRQTAAGQTDGADETLTDDWTSTREMPSGIRIAFLDPKTRQIVASVRIPLIIDAEPGCAAPRSGVCSYVENGEADAVDLRDLPPEAVDARDPRGWLSYAR